MPARKLINPIKIIIKPIFSLAKKLRSLKENAEKQPKFSKGKAGVPVELGVRVCVLEDQYQFVLHHRIMWKEIDDKVAAAMIEDAKRRYPALSQCSFDKGFYTPTNRDKLDQLLEVNVLPKKGRLNVVDQAREESETFHAARRQHSAVESCINNLEVRGSSVRPETVPLK